MAAPTKAYTFDNDPPDTNPVDADQMNENFDRLYNYLSDGVDTYAPESVGPSALAAGAALSNIGPVPHARAYRTASQSIPKLTNTPIALTAEAFDSDSMHDNVTNNTRLTCQRAGVYLFTGSIMYLPASSGRAYCFIQGSTGLVASNFEPLDSVAGAYVSCTGLYRMAVGDYVQLGAWHDYAGGAIDVSSNPDGTFLSAVWLGL